MGVQIEVMDWERLGKDEPMGKVSLPVEDAVNKSSEGGFWLNLKECKSGKVMVSTEFSGTKTLRTITKTITESASRKESSKTDTILESTSISTEHQSTITNQEENLEAVEQEPKSTIGKGDQGDNIKAENKKQSSKKETTASWKDDDDGAQGLKSSLLKDDKKETIRSDKSEEDTTIESNEKSEKKENVSNSAVIEVAKS